MTTVEIGLAGETHVANALKSKNHSNVVQDTKQPGKTDVTANGIRVQVKTATAPDEPAELSAAEKSAIIQRSKANNSIAWAAYVQIKQTKELNRPIRWVQLN